VLTRRCHTTTEAATVNGENRTTNSTTGGSSSGSSTAISTTQPVGDQMKNHRGQEVQVRMQGARSLGRWGNGEGEEDCCDSDDRNMNSSVVIDSVSCSSGSGGSGNSSDSAIGERNAEKAKTNVEIGAEIEIEESQWPLWGMTLSVVADLLHLSEVVPHLPEVVPHLSEVVLAHRSQFLASYNRYQIRSVPFRFNNPLLQLHVRTWSALIHYAHTHIQTLTQWAQRTTRRLMYKHTHITHSTPMITMRSSHYYYLSVCLGGVSYLASGALIAYYCYYHYYGSTAQHSSE
jgi:hypothetical protein